MHHVHTCSLKGAEMETQKHKEGLLQKGLRRALNSRVAAILTYPHGVDRYLEQFDRRWSTRSVRAEIVGLQRQTDDTVTVQLRPNGNWQGFKAGQYVRLSVEIDGVRRTRCFSPANSVHARNGLLELTCKIGPASQVARYLDEHAECGEVLELSQAEGEFALPDIRPERVLLISGGSGITPALSMLRTLTDEGHAGPITFLHYCNSAASQLYPAELEQIAARHANVDLIRCYAQSNQNEYERGELEGFFSQAQLEQAVPDFREAETFLCGPPAMMQAVESAYDAEGIRSRLHLERFSAAPVAVASGTAGGELRFARSERLSANNGDTLLNQAEAAGLKPESGCRMGICHACTCRKVSGQVRDIRTGQVSDAGEAVIQICVSVPVGDVTLDI